MTGTPVALHYGDPYLHRLATQTLRLHIQRDAIDQVLGQHNAEIRNGLNARNLTRLQLDGLIIRRNGPRDIDILTTR